MRRRLTRRAFVRALGVGGAGVLAAACEQGARPPQASAPSAATQSATAATGAKQGERLVVATSQWGTETPYTWQGAAPERRLWDHAYDTLLRQDPKTGAYQPGLATSWTHAPDYKSWTFQLRKGVMFHGTWGELTGEDVKFTVEQSLKPGVSGADTSYFKTFLDTIEIPDKYTVVMRFKSPTWELPSRFGIVNGLENIVCKKYLESVGLEKAAQHPIGTGPYRWVEGRQGDFHRFEANPAHWRKVPGFKELVVRRVVDADARLSGLRAGEIDLAEVTGDFVGRAKQAGFRIRETPGVIQYWMVLPGQTLPDKPDYSPSSPWVGDPNDPAAQEKARKVRLALNLAVNKQAIVDGLWGGFGALTPFAEFFYPQNAGYSADWKIPPYDPARAKQLFAEAGYLNGFEIKVVATQQQPDSPDVAEAVSQDWERVGLKVTRSQEDYGTFLPKIRARKIGGAFAYGLGNPYDEAVLAWQRLMLSTGALYLLAESKDYDKSINAGVGEFDQVKRVQLQREFGQRLYNDYRSVRLGVKSATWATGKRVGDWPVMAPSTHALGLEYVSPA